VGTLPGDGEELPLLGIAALDDEIVAFDVPQHA
jgi:hypothetical protein